MIQPALLPITSGVPIPERTRTPNGTYRVLGLERLEVGQSVLVPDDVADLATIRVWMSRESHLSQGRRFVAKPAGVGVRVWREV